MFNENYPSDFNENIFVNDDFTIDGPIKKSMRYVSHKSVCVRIYFYFGTRISRIPFIRFSWNFECLLWLVIQQKVKYATFNSLSYACTIFAARSRIDEERCIDDLMLISIRRHTAISTHAHCFTWSNSLVKKLTSFNNSCVADIVHDSLQLYNNRYYLNRKTFPSRYYLLLLTLYIFIFPENSFTIPNH